MHKISCYALAAAALLVAPLSVIHAFTPMRSRTTKFSYTGFSSSLSASFSSWMETDYASLHNRRKHDGHKGTPTGSKLTLSATDEQLFLRSSVSTYDVMTDAYLNLPTLWSGSQIGQPSMMEELSQKGQDLQNKLAAAAAIAVAETKEEQQSLSSNISTSPVMEKLMPKPVARKVTSSTNRSMISFESDGLMMIEKRRL
jgi:hypothetical protein